MKPKSEHYRQVNITLTPAIVEAFAEIMQHRIDQPTMSQLIREAGMMYLEALQAPPAEEE